MNHNCKCTTTFTTVNNEYGVINYRFKYEAEQWRVFLQNLN